MMKRFSLSKFAAAALLAALLTAPLAAQTTQASSNSAPASGPAPSIVNRSGAPVDVNHIIRSFTAKETQFRQALNNYQFKRDAVIQTIAMGGQISGEYRRVSRFIFDDSGSRFEKILFFPMPTIQEIQITPEDLEDLGGVQAFALETSKIGDYEFAYVGKERIDELDLYVFDVTPKILSDQKRLSALKKSKTPERFFQGRIWVDDKDYQIVKARGKGVPEFDQRFPTFETYREQIDGRFWFPTYAYADDELVFKNGFTVRVRLRIKYSDFELLKGKFRIVDEEEPGVEVPEEKNEKPATTPAPTAKPATTPTPPTAKPKP